VEPLPIIQPSALRFSIPPYPQPLPPMHRIPPLQPLTTRLAPGAAFLLVHSTKSSTTTSTSPWIFKTPRVRRVLLRNRSRVRIVLWRRRRRLR
jgi:hypothetical protein